jgi:ABC-type transporter Mla subunit MlaD
MSTEKIVMNSLFGKTELASEKIKLAAIDDFKEIFNKANNEQAKIATTLVDNLAKASNDFKGNLADWQKASVIGNQLIAKAKELGVELPAPILNSVKASEIEVKNTPSVLSNISKLYSVF